MKVQALTKYVRISPIKLRYIAREIVGLQATYALQALELVPRKSARLLHKTIKSAVANAENNFNIPASNLILTEAVIGDGPVLKRFRPAARGSAHPIRKRTSHIKIVLTSGHKVAKDHKE